MFLVTGLLGIFVQGFVLKFFNDCLGERHLVMFSFALGTVSNVVYGLATEKSMIFWGVAISAFVGMSFPTISAIKSNNVVCWSGGTMIIDRLTCLKLRIRSILSFFWHRNLPSKVEFKAHCIRSRPVHPRSDR